MPMTVPENIYTVIIPAAGRSRRMKRFKPLLPWPPGVPKAPPVICSTVKTFLEAGLTRIIVVTGHRGDEIARVLQDFPVEIIRNPDPDAPMSSSVAAAMTVVSPDSHVMVMPGDHPGVRPGTVRKIMECHRRNPRWIITVDYRGKGGHPVIFPRAARNDLLLPDPGQGLRALFSEGTYTVHRIATDDPGVVINLDRPEDYIRAQRIFNPPSS